MSVSDDDDGVQALNEKPAAEKAPPSDEQLAAVRAERRAAKAATAAAAAAAAAEAANPDASNVKYNVNDAVALMPLLVGFAPEGRNNDLGLFDPLCIYRPPKADILKRTWELHHRQTLDLVAEAMKKCNTSCVFALGAVTTKTYRTGETRAATNHYIAVLGRVAKIENRLAAILIAKKDKIAKNAQSLRKDAFSSIRSKRFLSDGVALKTAMTEFLQENSTATESQLRKIFHVDNPDSRVWVGLDKFKTFWTSLIDMVNPEETVKYENLLLDQEKSELDFLKSTVDGYASFYSNAYTGLNSSLQTSVRQEYLTKVFGSEENIAISTKIAAYTRTVDRDLEKYLWNVILERLMLLNSVVSSFFSSICATRNTHTPLVNRFMDQAIIYCTAPLFTSVRTPLGDSKADTTVRDIRDSVKQHEDGFISFLTNVFSADNGISTKIRELSPAERGDIQTHFSSRLLVKENGRIVLLGPRLETKEKTGLYTEIETLLSEKMRGYFPTKALSAHFTNKEGKVVIPVRHGATMKAAKPPPGEPLADGIPDPYAKKIDLVKLITGKIGQLSTLDGVFKQIVYYKIFSDSVCFGMFHYNENNKDAAAFYFSCISHPLGLKTTPGGDARSAKMIQDARVPPAASRENLFSHTASDIIKKSIKLKEGFTPTNPTPTNQPPGGKKKKKQNKKSKGATKKKNKNPQSEKKGPNPPKAGKGKGAKNKKTA